MGELVTSPGLQTRMVHTLVRVNLYCWPCRTVHEFELAEVEQIVYALGALETDAEHTGYLDGYADGKQSQSRAVPTLTPDPTCLQIVLSMASDGDGAVEHVEQGIECREAHEPEAMPTKETS